MPERPNIPLSQIPLESSREVIAALNRLGAHQAGVRRGTHAYYERETPDGRILTATVILARRQMARKTLRTLLYNLEITIEDFKNAL